MNVSTVAAQRKVALILVPIMVLQSVPIVLGLAGAPIGFGFSHLGPKLVAPAPPQAWELALVVAAAYLWITFKRVYGVRRNIRTGGMLKLLSLVAAFTAGISEEALFRRFIINTALQVGASAVVAVLASAFAFGAAHAIWGFFGERNARAFVGPMIATSALGAALAVVYLIGGRALGPCVAAHILIVVVVEPALLLTAVEGSWDHEPAAERPSFS
jgi:membrane protease YdiL (CAAX protease family)